MGKKLPLLYVHDRATQNLQDTLWHFRVEEKSTRPLRDLVVGSQIAEHENHARNR
jgi:hypothetical protein